MIQPTPNSTGARWARFRFSVVGSLLSSPPAADALKTAIRSLADKTWSHPITGRDARFSAVTIERWYYTARRGHDDPVGALRRAVRKDCGKVSLAAGPGRAAHVPVPRSPALELSTSLRQPRRAGEGRSFTGAAPLLFHGQALHAGSRLGAQAEAPARRTPWRGTCGNQTPGTGDPQLRSRPTSERSGISISTTDRSRCSLPAASGCGRSRWASSMTTRDCAATSSGISRRPPRTWCTDSPRRSRNGACRVLC